MAPVLVFHDQLFVHRITGTWNLRLMWHSALSGLQLQGPATMPWQLQIHWAASWHSSSEERKLPPHCWQPAFIHSKLAGLCTPTLFRHRTLRVLHDCSCCTQTKRLPSIASQPFCKWPRHEYRFVLIRHCQHAQHVWCRSGINFMLHCLLHHVQ